MYLRLFIQNLHLNSGECFGHDDSNTVALTVCLTLVEDSFYVCIHSHTNFHMWIWICFDCVHSFMVALTTLILQFLIGITKSNAMTHISSCLNRVNQMRLPYTLFNKVYKSICQFQHFIYHLFLFVFIES